MPRLRHIALVVKDLEKSAAFYERAFGLRRVEGASAESATARRVFLTDGEVNLALLQYKGSTGAGGVPEGFVGLHHFGFEVEDLAAAQARVEGAGARYYFDLGKEEDEEFERKFRDPDGILFDISHKGWAGTPIKSGKAGKRRTAPRSTQRPKSSKSPKASKSKSRRRARRG
ncbi:MAG TPA: VOC family protein [Alphaproteobacteria bacterium]|nr:VOC family protein [Alphaproteobacteria bacterium]